MVALRNHGGSCCGAQHIHGFSQYRQSEDMNELQQYTAQRDLCLHEVILNKSQCQNMPHLLKALADMGYVLTTGFVNGNHDSSVYVFHRASMRLSLEALDFEWTGQIASSTLHGRLPTMTHPPAKPDGYQAYVEVGSFVCPSQIRKGDRFRYAYSGSTNHGRIFERVHHPRNLLSFEDKIRLRDVQTGQSLVRSVYSLRWLSQAAYPDGKPQERTTPSNIPVSIHKE